MNEQDLKDEKIKILVSRVIAGESVAFRRGNYNSPRRIFTSEGVRRLLDEASDNDTEDQLDALCSSIAGAAIGARQELMVKIFGAIGDIIEENFEAIIEYERELAQ